METRAIHYLASDKPLGTPVAAPANRSSCCPTVSAGHSKHEYTTGCAWPMIKEQFDRVKFEEITEVFEDLTM